MDDRWTSLKMLVFISGDGVQESKQTTENDGDMKAGLGQPIWEVTKQEWPQEGKYVGRKTMIEALIRTG